MDHLSHVKSIDCDVHPSVPGMRALMPYLEDFWRDSVEDRGITSLESISYPPNAPISARSDFRRRGGRAAMRDCELRAQILDRWGMGFAAVTCSHGVELGLNGGKAR